MPVALMELRIGPGAKLGRSPTTADRQVFGRQLIGQLEAAVLEP